MLIRDQYPPRTPFAQPRPDGDDQESDRRPAWVRRLDDRIRVAPDLPRHLKVERPVR